MINSEMKSPSSPAAVMAQPSLQATEDVLDRIFPHREVQRVLLINPPDIHSDMFQVEAARRYRYSNYPPYGLAVLAQHLRQIDLDVRILNLNHEILESCFKTDAKTDFVFDDVWQSKLDREIANFRPDLLGVTCLFTMTHTSFRNVCNYASRFDVPLAIGGCHVSNDVERILDDIPHVKMAFLRESDISLKKFVQVVNRESLATELGQVILNLDGERHRHLQACRPNAEEISEIPAYDLLDVADYSQYCTFGAFYHLVTPETRCATVLSNRGCRGQCTFCGVHAFNGPGVRLRKIESIVDELELLKNDYGIGHVMWLDDDLFNDHGRVISLFNEMVHRNLGMTWDATNGVVAASCTDEVIAAAAESGCIGLHLGMESGNQEMLKSIRKPSSVKHFLRAAEVLRKHEQIFASIFVMIGFPGETMAMIADTLTVARRMDLDWCSIGHLMPLPNTPIYDAMVEQGLISDVGSKEARFTLGHYGKARQKESEAAPPLTDLASIPPDTIPTAEQLVEIWFYMDFHLNYQRLFAETRPVKIEQQMKQLKKVSDVLYVDHCFALYFLAYLQHKVRGMIDPAILPRLKNKLATSVYWKARFEAFGLSLHDVETGEFPDR